MVQNWAQLPEGMTFGIPSAVATDSHLTVYVLQRGDPPVLAFDPTGKYIGSWGSGQFSRPHGFFIANDTAYVTDSDASVAHKYTLEGQHLLTLGTRDVHSDTGTEIYGDLVPRAAGPFNHPTKMVMGPSGHLYVSDGERNARVHRFTPDGHLLASWGVPGKNGLGEFHLPHSLFVDNDDRVYVCDRENSCLQVFTGDGVPAAIWTDLRPPTDIAMDVDGAFYVAQFAFNVTHRYPGYPPPAGWGSTLKDAGGRRTIRHDAPPQISILDRDGNALTSWTSRKAHGLCVDSRGNIYTAVEDEKAVDKYVLLSN